MAPLTAEEITILQGIIDGKSIKQVAYKLGKTEGAVKVLLFRARQRAGVETLYQLVAIAAALGLCNIDSYLKAQPIIWTE